MKLVFVKSIRGLVADGLILAFLLGLSLAPFSQAREFQKSAKSLESNSITSFSHPGEYDLISNFSEKNHRLTLIQENRNYLHFLSVTVPFSNSLLHYFNSVNFTYNLHLHFNCQLHNIPPPAFS